MITVHIQMQYEALQLAYQRRLTEAFTERFANSEGIEGTIPHHISYSEEEIRSAYSILLFIDTHLIVVQPPKTHCLIVRSRSQALSIRGEGDTVYPVCVIM